MVELSRDNSAAGYAVAVDGCAFACRGRDGASDWERESWDAVLLTCSELWVLVLRDCPLGFFGAAPLGLAESSGPLSCSEHDPPPKSTLHLRLFQAFEALIIVKIYLGFFFSFFLAVT